MAMTQQDLGLNLNKRRTRKAVLLNEKNLVAPGAGQEHAPGRHPAQAGAGQGAYRGQGGTPISCHQTAVRLHQSQVPGAGQEHGPSGDAVCAEQSVDGAAQSFAGAAEIKGQRQG